MPYSAVSQEAVAKFGLHETGKYVRFDEAGHTEALPTVVVDDLALGTSHARDIQLAALRDMPKEVSAPPFLGIFGVDFLSNYDVDIDVPNRRFGLYDMQDCAGQIAPLDPPYFVVPFTTHDGEINVDIKLNGALLHAIFDTGASRTLVVPDDAQAAGVKLTDSWKYTFKRGRGDARKQPDLSIRYFGQLEVGAEQLANFRFLVGDLHDGDTILGADFMRFNRVWISYSHHLLFIKPDFGNPVVRMDTAAEAGKPKQ